MMMEQKKELEVLDFNTPEMVERRKLKEEVENARRIRIQKRNFYRKIHFWAAIISTVILTLGAVYCGVKIHNHNEYYNYSNYLRDSETIVYSSYIISGGDTLESISKSLVENKDIPVPYRVEMNEICKINNIVNPDWIKQGQVIIYPYIVNEEEFKN